MGSGLETAMIKARNAEKRGDFSEAERVYETILQRFPRNARARKGLDGLSASRSGAVMRADAPPQPVLDRLADLFRHGRNTELVTEADAQLAHYPRSAFVHNLLAAAWLGLGRPEKAESTLRRALAQDIRHPAICNNLGMALAALGRHGEAADAYREAIALNPRHAAAHNNLGNSLKEMARMEAAVDAYRAALAIEPDYADAGSNLGVVLRDLGRREEAREVLEQVLKHRPDHAAALNNLGNLRADGGDVSGAIGHYEKALAIDPAYSEAHFNLGNALKRQGRIAEASRAYERARAARPNYADAWLEQGKALAIEDRLAEAVGAFDEALAIEPGHASARMHGLFYRAHMCDWSALASFDGADESADTVVPPFALLPFEDDPARQLRRSRAWAETLGVEAPPFPPHAPAADGRIRIGYFSADFHDHATMYLLSGLLREHDRSRFEVHAFSFGPERDDTMRRELRAQVDSFTDVRDMADAEVVALARARGIDIAVDLKGYTFGGRAQLFAERLAPLQIAYLGYPGSMGADFIDYLVADERVVPEAERAHYSEKLLLLPGSYQCNDDRRPIPDSATTRAHFGLPEDGFVFCSFNQNYKISPREFAVWMRLLASVEGSVLWLLRSNDWAEANLRREAEARGIAPERLVFSPKLAHGEHLARHRHADLFLDSFAVNAHTTASDALWAGLPLVTLAGRQFAARVGASLLHAVGLPEFVAQSEAEYEALALDLARARDRLAALRQKLAENRLTEPLFDTVRHARAIEAAYTAALARQRAGQPPEHIAVPE